MMKKIIFVFLFCVCCFNSFAQGIAPAIQWQNTIGGSKSDLFSSLQQANEGGYILGGTSISNISGDKTEDTIGAGDFWVVKLNST